MERTIATGSGGGMEAVVVMLGKRTKETQGMSRVMRVSWEVVLDEISPLRLEVVVVFVGRWREVSSDWMDDSMSASGLTVVGGASRSDGATVEEPSIESPLWAVVVRSSCCR